jgi:hypothetical protein
MDEAGPDSDARSRNWKAGLIIPILVLGWFVADHFLSRSRGEAQHQILLQELSAITDPPGASIIETTDHFSTWNAHKALVGRVVDTRLSFAKSAEFYAGQLRHNQWRAVPSFQGELLRFCKGRFGAFLKPDQHTPTSYYLGIQWSTNHCE